MVLSITSLHQLIQQTEAMKTALVFTLLLNLMMFIVEEAETAQGEYLCNFLLLLVSANLYEGDTVSGNCMETVIGCNTFYTLTNFSKSIQSSNNN